MRTTGRAWIASFLSGLSACGALMGCAGIVLSPQEARASETQNQRAYTAHWCVTTNINELRWRSRVDWSAQMDFRGVNIRRDTFVIYEQYIVDDVRSGGLAVTLTPGYWSRLDQKMVNIYNFLDPGDPNAPGMGVLDIEFIPFIWGNRTDGPGIYPPPDPPSHRRLFDLWYTHIRDNQPELLAGRSVAEQEEVLKSTYEQTLQTWVLYMLAKSRELRPNKKWTYYGFPGASYWEYEVPGHQRRVENDRLEWLYTAVDVIAPSIYQLKQPRPEGQPLGDPWFNYYIRDNVRYWRNTLEECVRVGQGKKIYPFIMLRYPFNVTPRADEYVGELELDHMLRLPKEFGADGIIIWDDIPNQAFFTQMQSFLDQNVLPTLATLLVEPVTPPTPPPSGGGAGGGESGNDEGGQVPPPDPGAGSGGAGSGGAGSDTGSGSGGSGSGGSGGSDSGIITVTGGSGSGSGSSGGGASGGSNGSGNSGGSGSPGAGNSGGAGSAGSGGQGSGGAGGSGGSGSAGSTGGSAGSGSSSGANSGAGSSGGGSGASDGAGSSTGGAPSGGGSNAGAAPSGGAGPASSGARRGIFPGGNRSAASSTPARSSGIIRVVQSNSTPAPATPSGGNNASGRNNSTNRTAAAPAPRANPTGRVPNRQNNQASTPAPRGTAFTRMINRLQVQAAQAAMARQALQAQQAQQATVPTTGDN